MPDHIVIAGDAGDQLYALEDQETQRCMVYLTVSGPDIALGDVLVGGSCTRGHCEFRHPNGAWQATAYAGPLSRVAATMIVKSSLLSRGDSLSRFKA